MKSLRERLAQFDRAPATSPAHPCGDRRAALDGLCEQGARWVGEGPAAYLRREVEFPVVATDSLPTNLWNLLGGEPPPMEGPWVVVDTETTGLESGTGTLVFLVAALFWQDDRGRLVQYFLPEPVAEARLLEDLVADLRPASAYLSYNGKSFDWPRLRTRLRLHRIGEEVLDRPHLDLLHPVRRLARDWLVDARLATVEAALLGRPRVDDLPGSEAPEVYRALQMEGADVGLTRVVEHNDLDVRRLVDLFDALADIVERDGWRDLPAAARASLGRLLVARGEGERAEEVLLTVAEGSDEPHSTRSRRLLADLLRRRGEVEGAVRLLEEGLESAKLSLDIRVRLAKLYEHRLRDPRRARHLTLEALRQCRELDQLGRPPAARDCRPEALVHRLRRLERKLLRAPHD